MSGAAQTAAAAPGPQAEAAPRPPEHDARKLTAGGVEARIRLGESLYTLRITRQGKLILTK